MFRAELTSRLSELPHSLHSNLLIARPATPFGPVRGLAPQHEQVCEVNASFTFPFRLFLVVRAIAQQSE